MATIGRVLSPEVAAALIRRGESPGDESFIRRDPDVTTQIPGQGAAGELAILREERLERQAELDEERALRGEGFAREQFDFQKTEKEKDRISRGEILEDETTAEKAKSVAGARKQAQKILGDIAGMLRNARKPNPDTGQPDPDAVREAQTIAQGMWAQYMTLPIPDEEKKKALVAMRSMLGTVPPSRTQGPGNPFDLPPPGQGGPPPGDAFEGYDPGGALRDIGESIAGGIGKGAEAVGDFVDPILRSAFSIPTRTP